MRAPRKRNNINIGAIIRKLKDDGLIDENIAAAVGLEVEELQELGAQETVVLGRKQCAQWQRLVSTMEAYAAAFPSNAGGMLVSLLDPDTEMTALMYLRYASGTSNTSSGLEGLITLIRRGYGQDRSVRQTSRLHELVAA